MELYIKKKTEDGDSDVTYSSDQNYGDVTEIGIKYSDNDENAKSHLEIENYYFVYKDCSWYLGKILNNENKNEVKFLSQNLDVAVVIWSRQNDF